MPGRARIPGLPTNDPSLFLRMACAATNSGFPLIQQACNPPGRGQPARSPNPVRFFGGQDGAPTTKVLRFLLLAGTAKPPYPTISPTIPCAAANAASICPCSLPPASAICGAQPPDAPTNCPTQD